MQDIPAFCNFKITEKQEHIMIPPTTGIYFTTEPAWYLIIIILASIWLVLMYYRKSYRMRQQIAVACFATLLAFVMENIAVFHGIWDYTGGNWPIVLWPTYFISAMMMYQMAKLADEWIPEKRKRR